MKVSQILRSKRKEIGLSVKDALLRLDEKGIVISAKTLYGWESGHRQPDADTFMVLCEIYGIDSFAKKPYTPTIYSNYQINASEMSLLEKYRQFDDISKKAVDTLIDIEYERCRVSKEVQDNDNVVYLQRSEQSASAGTGAYLGPESFTTLCVEANALTRKASFAVPISGDSMEPKFHDGDIVLVQGMEDIPVGEIGIFTLDCNGYLKIRGNGELISLNPRYDPVKMDESIRCNGLVIGTLAREWIR